jgi:hypothetical protein
MLRWSISAATIKAERQKRRHSGLHLSYLKNFLATCSLIIQSRISGIILQEIVAWMYKGLRFFNFSGIEKLVSVCFLLIPCIMHRQYCLGFFSNCYWGMDLHKLWTSGFYRSRAAQLSKVEEQIRGCFPDRGLGNLSTISVTGDIRSTSKASLVNYCICSILKRR